MSLFISSIAEDIGYSLSTTGKEFSRP